MSNVALDLRTLATLAIFVATYAGVALGRVPGLRIDRAGIALVGASLMVAVGTLDLDEAFQAIDLDAIALLLGMMIIVAQLRVSGFFEIASRFAIERARGPLVLMAAISAVTGVFSAFLVNDAICLVMTPLVIEVCRALRRNPVPYLLMVAMAANAGSVATITGNPQNMIIGVASGIPYVEFAARMTPIATVAVALAFGFVALCYRQEMSAPFAAREDLTRPRRHPRQLGKGILVTSGVVMAFFAGVPIAKAAIIGGSFLLLSRAVNPRKIYAGVDGGLLLMFSGLFIVVAGAEKMLLTPEAIEIARRLRLENTWALSGLTALLSNLVSNVPAVLVLKPFVGSLPDPARAWLVIAMSSTLAGNLTLVGSVANLIVAERAKLSGAKLSFLDHLRVGLPVTVLGIVFGTWWLMP